MPDRSRTKGAQVLQSVAVFVFRESFSSGEKLELYLPAGRTTLRTLSTEVPVNQTAIAVARRLTQRLYGFSVDSRPMANYVRTNREDLVVYCIPWNKARDRSLRGGKWTPRINLIPEIQRVIHKKQ